ncbi:MAG: ferritin-like domain-containing protein [Planctomycetota bacterium]|nr:ferritin-like domain-containing protein [Planctomycetota bacterium]
MMDAEGKIQVLNRALHNAVNSVVQYLEISTPHVPPGHEEKFEEVKRIRNEEIDTANRLVDLINELDGVPKVGVFPYWNVDLNYLDLRFMARFSADHVENAVRELEADLESVQGDGAVYGLLKDVLAQRREHVAVLRDIGGAEEADGETAEADTAESEPA